MTEAESYYRSEAIRLFEEAYKQQESGRLDDAIELYRKSIEVYPTAEAHTYLGWALSRMGKYPDAIQECRRAIGIDPEYGNPYNDIGAYLIETGQPDEALTWLEKAAQAPRYDNYCYPHYNMGRVWEKKGNWLRALSCYQQALKENEDYRLARHAANRVLSLLN